MKGVKYSFFFVFFFTINCQGQTLFPIIKIGELNLDDSMYLDLTDMEFYQQDDSINITKEKRERFLILNNHIQMSTIQEIELPFYGKVSIPVRNSFEQGFSNVANIEFYSCNSGMDTLLINSNLYLEVNPFPNIYCHKVKVQMPNDQNSDVFVYKYIGVPLYTFFSTGELSSAPVVNNEFGSVKFFFDVKGNKICEGAYLSNKKNGPWKYYNKRGKLRYIEYYKEDSLVITTEKKSR